MVTKIPQWFMDSKGLEKAIIISIIIGIGIAAIVIIETKEERFSYLYLNPESYTNFPEGNTTSFIFGVKSYEKERTAYELEIFLSDRLMESKHLELDPGEVYEEKKTIEIPTIKFPAKVKLVLKSPFDIYDTHYWLKTREQYLVPTMTVTEIPRLTPTPIKSNKTSGYNQTSEPAISDFASIRIYRDFVPKSVNITKPGKIMWINNDARDRKLTLISKEGLFSQIIDIDKRFEYIFDKSGTYHFYLKEVPDIECVVIVH